MRTNPSFVVYVDESGDEGFSFDKGSSPWFVLSAVIIRKLNDLTTVKLVDKVRCLLDKPPKKPLHFRDLKHHQRLPFVDAISSARLRAISILIHKPSLKEPENFQDRYRLYFYAVRYLLERVSWCCRDHKHPGDGGDGSANIIFSNRSGMSYQEMKNYLDLLKRQSQATVFDVRVEWSVIKTDQITSSSAGRRMGLQIADAVASSIFSALSRAVRHDIL